MGKPAYRTRGLSRSTQFFRGTHAGVTCILGPHLDDDAIELVLRGGGGLSGRRQYTPRQQATT
jgi:hypothetical protein